MPANLTPDYLAAEQAFKDAQTHAERLQALERMLSTIPKHKGTEKLQADIKRRLAQARKDSQKKGGAHHAPFWVVKREGAGQVALIGPPNSGKSQLLARLTHAKPEVADYPFTTRAPLPGMMLFEDVPIQLVDLPPVSAEHVEHWLPQVIRMAHAGVLVVDAARPSVLEELEYTLGFLDGHRLPAPELLVANKADLPGARESAAALDELYAGRFRRLSVSARTGENLDAFRRAVFDTLGIVRMYSKPPGKPADMDRPFLLKCGGTVLDGARLVHKDFAEHLKFARLYRSDGSHSGLMVDRNHLVEDRDVLEFHV
jgi:hypothetical protein